MQHSGTELSLNPYQGHQDDVRVHYWRLRLHRSVLGSPMASKAWVYWPRTQKRTRWPDMASTIYCWLELASKSLKLGRKAWPCNPAANISNKYMEGAGGSHAVASLCVSARKYAARPTRGHGRNGAAMVRWWCGGGRVCRQLWTLAN